MKAVQEQNKINDKQLHVLNILYRFRYGTADYLAMATGVKKQAMNVRLRRLFEQGYLDRKYDSSYKLAHKPAVYLLSKDGRAALRKISKIYRPDVLRRLSRDNTRSEDHISRWLSLLRVYATLEVRYGDDLDFFTANQLGVYDYFPQPLPDAFIRLKVDGARRGDRLFFLYMLSGIEHFADATAAVHNLIRYTEDSLASWETNTHREMPRVLFVCSTVFLQKRLTRKIRRAVYVVDGDLITVYSTTVAELGRDNTWQNILNTDAVLPLHDIG